MYHMNEKQYVPSFCQLEIMRKTPLMCILLFQPKLIMLKMDLYVTSPKQSQNEIFFVTFSLSIEKKQLTTSAFERITPYSIYSGCVDNGVELKLCVCDSNITLASELLTYEKAILHLQSAQITDSDLVDEMVSSMLNEDMEASVSVIKGTSKKCFYIVRQQNSAGVIYQGLSVCQGILDIVITFKYENLLLSNPRVVKVTFRPMDLLHIISGVVISLSHKWKCDIENVQLT